jgi:hypothetical protein
MVSVDENFIQDPNSSGDFDSSGAGDSVRNGASGYGGRDFDLAGLSDTGGVGDDDRVVSAAGEFSAVESSKEVGKAVWWQALDPSFHKEAQRYASLNDMMKAHTELRSSVSRKWSDFKKNDYELYKQQVDSFEGVPKSIAEYKLEVGEKKYRGPKGEYSLPNHFGERELDELKQVGFVAGLNNQQMQMVYEAMNHLMHRSHMEVQSQGQQIADRVKAEIYERWGAKDPKKEQEILHQLDTFFKSGVAEQLTGYSRQEIQEAMNLAVPAYLNPVLLSLFRGVAGLMSNSASAGINSKYMSQDQAKKLFQEFIADKDKMRIRTSWNHPRKEEMKREYRELYQMAHSNK